MLKTILKCTFPLAAIGATGYYVSAKLRERRLRGSNEKQAELVRRYEAGFSEFMQSTSSGAKEAFARAGLDYNVSESPMRSDVIQSLGDEEFDLVIVGGGVSGAASALEAVRRGLKVALVEKNDFASGTSSKSTKLIHGGVRYLEQAFKDLDFSMLHLVFEALGERQYMLNSAEYMNKPIPILIPLTKWWEIPYMYVGIKMYELLAIHDVITPSSHIVSKQYIEKEFPNLDTNGLGVIGGIMYYDGQMNDARYVNALAVTAAAHNAKMANYTEVTAVLHDKQGKACGVEALDRETGLPITIRAKQVLNCAGPFGDLQRKMDDPRSNDLVVTSAGSHIVLPSWTCNDHAGILVPKTPDGRVLFFLPYYDGSGVIAGTTDGECPLSDLPVPQEKEIEFIIDVMNTYLKKPISRSDVQSVWSGFRPLVRDPTVQDTKKLSRNHVVLTSESGMVSLMGGKFTTNHKMAEDALDALVGPRKNVGTGEVFGKSEEHRLIGEDSGSLGGLGSSSVQAILSSSFKLDNKVSSDLVLRFGNRALVIATMALDAACNTHTSKQAALADIHQFLPDAELQYTLNYEMTRCPDDFLLRRTRKGFFHSKDAAAQVQSVSARMGGMLGWSPARVQHEVDKTTHIIQHYDVNTFSTVSAKK